MMVTLYFNPQLFPRTTTKKEWIDIWRWKRVTQNKLREEMDKAMLNYKANSNIWPEHTKQDFINSIVNPPLLIHDKQQLP